MTSIVRLKRAKYKGVDFLYESMPTTGGNRIIKYNYPGSDKQAIESQGKLPRSFNFTIWIPHDGYYKKRDKLLEVLEDGKKGVLVHPTFGNIENVTNGEYTLAESITELGKASISVTFEIDDSTGIPQQSGSLASQVQAESGLLNSQLVKDLEEKFGVDLGFAGNFQDAFETISNFSESLNEITEAVTPAVDVLSDFTQSVNEFSSNIGGLVQAPGQLATGVSGLFESLNNLYETPERTFNVFKSFFEFGNNDPVVNTNTMGRIQRKQNRDAFRSSIKTQALSYSYVAAVQGNYSTTDDLELIQRDLENAYLDIRNNELISNEALEQLDRLRVQAQKTLDVLNVNTKSIIVIETKMKPLSVLAYQYYGNTNLVNELAELNNIKQNAFVEGQVQLLTV